MPKLTIDGQEIEVEAGMSILQACELADVEVPRFCYHERLSVAGNCRMCLVDVEMNGRAAPKPVASCTQPVADGMVVHTRNERAKAARGGVMEFLLINHPLDCPICDQGGECDLQDQAMAYGMDRSRYQENKRAVSDKELGPVIKTVMTRCIHCTRCVRFAEEVAGVPELGATGRGEDTEIGTYIEAALSTELAGNLADICPVGALTSKPNAFIARPWEMRKTNSIDVLDAVGSNIRVDARGGEVIRVLPRIHEDINEEWLSDKSRLVVDGLRRQRLDRPYVRDMADGKLKPATWSKAFSAIRNALARCKGKEMATIVGDQCDAESMFALRELMSRHGCKTFEGRQDGAAIKGRDKALKGARSGYLFNSTIAGLDETDAILLVGCNPRVEAPLVNTRILRAVRQRQVPVMRIGPEADLTYQVQDLGNDPSLLNDFAKGQGVKGKRGEQARAQREAIRVLKSAKKPMIILGMSALQHEEGGAILSAAEQAVDTLGLSNKDWNGFNILHTAAARVAALDLGYGNGPGLHALLKASKSGKTKFVYVLGADEFDSQALANTFVVYQGHHGDRTANVADVILPGAAYTEKDGLYINLEGRVQHGRGAVNPPGDAREDWAILRALSVELETQLPYDTLAELRAALVTAHSQFGVADAPPNEAWISSHKTASCELITNTAMVETFESFWQTCAISRNSEVMAQCRVSQSQARACQIHTSQKEATES